MKAIDLYSGIGGWTLGLELAGIEIISSYEWWNKANRTHNKNTNRNTKETDIRKLKLDELPKGVDIVVGSPPCTQFSFANKGGNGDIEDGLIDLKKFLDVVKHIKPKYWAMENVPRVSKIIELETKEGGCLEEYKNLFTVNEIIDMSEYGVPQKRKRMIAGNFPFDLLKSYKKKLKQLTMGEVLKSLYNDKPTDILYGVSINKGNLTDNEHEEYLNEEELRINSDSKRCHHIYNKMAFPDSFEKPVRTITATCTRVSRESVIIEDIENPKHYRRLTVRERGLLQGFPISYQYFGDSHAEKLKMIGNAIPPAFTYYLANSMKEVKFDDLVLLNKRGKDLLISKEQPKKTKPDTKARKFQKTRKFRAAIPLLRFGSGVRFDLSNSFDIFKRPDWKISFYYGNSKKIYELNLNNNLLIEIKKLAIYNKIEKIIENFENALVEYLDNISPEELQNIWIHQDEGKTPYQIVDFLDIWTNKIVEDFEKINNIENIFSTFINYKTNNINKKLGENPLYVFSGFLIGITFNKTSLYRNY